MVARIILGTVCAMTLAIASAPAQQKTVRVRGTIEQVEGAVLSLKSREGETLKVKLADDAKIVAMVPAALADIKQGSFVGATAMPDEGGRWKAVEVHVFPEAMRGTGEGDRPNDYRPKSTMTNGTVGTVSPVGTSGSAGVTVAKAEGTTLTLNYKTGEKRIDVTPDTVILYLCARRQRRSQVRGDGVYFGRDAAG